MRLLARSGTLQIAAALDAATGYHYSQQGAQPMPTDTAVILDRVICIHEHDGSGHSEPYVWPVLLWIDDATLETADLVGVAAPDRASARIVIQHDMQAGDIADLPGAVKALSAPIADGLQAIMLVVLLWEMDDSPGDAVTAGFDAFAPALRAAVAGHLLALNDPTQRDQAVAEIKASVRKGVELAIMSKLSLVDKLTLDFDDNIGADTAIVTSLPGAGSPTPLSLTFGQQPGGQLQFYRDQNRDGTGDVGGPAIIGQSGWQDFQFLFGGGNGIIYAVDNDGRLLFNLDRNQDGTGDVGAPSIIGQSGWQDYRFLFGGGNGIIYAVDNDGRLLFYRDQNQDGTGDVGAPAVIGLNGWQDYRFLFSGGNGIIYAVDQVNPTSSRYEIDAHLEVAAPNIELSPVRLDFGQVRIGQSRHDPLRIANTGLAPASISVADTTNGNFAWEPVETTLQPQTSIALEIEFTPHRVGIFRDTVTVTSATDNSTHTAPLVGSAIKGGPPSAPAS